MLLQNQEVLGNMNWKIRNQVVKYNMINGGYQIEVGGLMGTITDSLITLKGCNTMTTNYNLQQDGSISFSNTATTQYIC